MGSRSSKNQVQIITRDGEVKIKLEIDININGGDITVKAAQGGGDRLEEKEENIWAIPDFTSLEKINFGKEVKGE
jgi:hypothetical protein